MSLIICGFGSTSHTEALREIVNKYGKKSTILISPIAHERLQSDVIRIDFQDLAYSEHKIINYKKLPPIDASLLEKLSFAENMYMQLLNRLEVKRGKKVSYQERKDSYINDLRILNHLIDKYKVTICVIDYIPHLGFDYLLYELCRLKKIKVVMQSYALAIPNNFVSRYFLNSIGEPLPRLKSKYLFLLKTLDDFQKNSVECPNRLQSYIDYYDRESKEIKSLVSLEAITKNRNTSKIIKYFKSTIRMLLTRDCRLFPAIKLRTKEYFRLKKVYKLIENCAKTPDKGEKYIYFPLHYQPECTSLPMGFYYSDQRLIVDMLSKVLPPEMSLYIKSHPNPSIYADCKFYKDLLKNKNVYILPRNANTYDLIDNAQAVATITGTVGWESIVRGIPVIMFGNFFYQYFSNVFHIKSLDDCKNAIDTIKKRSVNKEKSKQELKLFLNVLDEYLYEGFLDDDYYDIYDISVSENNKNMVKGYIDFIENEENWIEE